MEVVVLVGEVVVIKSKGHLHDGKKCLVVNDLGYSMYKVEVLSSNFGMLVVSKNLLVKGELI